MKRKFETTTIEDDAKPIDIEKSVTRISKVLDGKYKKPIIQQENNIIFNVFNSIDIITLESLSNVEFVNDLAIHCNQYSLIIEVELSDKIISKRLKDNELDLANLLALEKKVDYSKASRKINFHIPEDKYPILNDILKLTLFTLYADGCTSSRNQYRLKKPFYLIILELKEKKCKWGTLSKIKQCSKKIQDVSVRFDTTKKIMKILLKIKL